MKRAILVVLALAFIVLGTYGTYYFISIHDSEILLNEALLNIKTEDYSNAIQLLKKAYSKSSSPIVQAPSLYLMGKTYISLGKYKQSLAAFEQLIMKVQSRLVKNWRYQALVEVSRLYRSGRVPVSKRQLSLLKEYLTTILSELELMDKNPSIARFERPYDSFLYWLLSINYRLNTKENSIQEIQEDITLELAYLHLNSGEYEKSIALFSKLNTQESKFGLAKALIESGKIPEGLSLLEKAIPADSTGELKKFYTETMYQYAQRLYRKKQYTTAIRYFRKIIDKNYSQRYKELSLYYCASYYYHNRGQFRIALGYLNKILSNTIGIKDEDALLMKGYIYYDLREYMQAYKVFNNFIRRYPHSTKLKEAKAWKEMCERVIRYLG